MDTDIDLLNELGPTVEVMQREQVVNAINASITSPTVEIPVARLSEQQEFYLKQLCGINGVSYALLDKGPYIGVLDRKDMNKIFFGALAQLPPVKIPHLQRKALEEVLSKRGGAAEALNNYLNRKERYLNYQRDTQKYHGEMVTALHRYEALSANTGIGLVEPIEALLSEGKVTLHTASAAEGYLEFKTVNDVVLVYKDALKKIDMRVVMGKYIIRFDVVRNTVKVFKGENNLIVNSYYHPHVGSGGNVCLGNASDAVNSAIQSCDVKALVNTILLLLSEYNPESPFAYLHAFVNNAKHEYVYTRWFRREEARGLLTSYQDYSYEDTWQERGYREILLRVYRLRGVEDSQLFVLTSEGDAILVPPTMVMFKKSPWDRLEDGEIPELEDSEEESEDSDEDNDE